MVTREKAVPLIGKMITLRGHRDVKLIDVGEHFIFVNGGPILAFRLADLETITWIDQTVHRIGDGRRAHS